MTRGYLNVEKLAPLLPDLVTVQIADLIEIYEKDRRLPRPRVAATQISLESDRSLASFDEAVAHITGPKLPDISECRLESGLSRRAVRIPDPVRSVCVSLYGRGLNGLPRDVVTVLRF